MKIIINWNIFVSYLRLSVFSDKRPDKVEKMRFICEDLEDFFENTLIKLEEKLTSTSKISPEIFIENDASTI